MLRSRYTKILTEAKAAAYLSIAHELGLTLTGIDTAAYDTASVLKNDAKAEVLLDVAIAHYKQLIYTWLGVAADGKYTENALRQLRLRCQEAVQSWRRTVVKTDK